jgi:hypothetical protein
MALYEDEKAQGTELPPIIGALREYVELEEVRSIPPIRKTRKIACPKTICFAGIVVIGRTIRKSFDYGMECDIALPCWG